VTHVVRRLRASGAIRSNRRSLIEIDRPHLEAAACECYQLMRRRLELINSTEDMHPSDDARPADHPRSQAPLFTKPDDVHPRTRTDGVIGHRSRSH